MVIFIFLEHFFLIMYNCVLVQLLWEVAIKMCELFEGGEKACEGEDTGSRDRQREVAAQMHFWPGQEDGARKSAARLQRSTTQSNGKSLDQSQRSDLWLCTVSPNTSEICIVSGGIFLEIELNLRTPNSAEDGKWIQVLSQGAKQLWKADSRMFSNHNVCLLVFKFLGHHLLFTVNEICTFHLAGD